MAMSIPLELAEYAIDFFHDDIHALATCALASRALLPRARFHIWRKITVPVEVDPLPHIRMQRLLEVLDRNMAIVLIVQSLTLKGVLSLQPRNRIRQYWDDPAGTLRHGPNQLLPVAYSLPHLEEITVVASHAILPRVCEARPPYRDSVVALDAPSKLRQLNLVGPSISWSFLEGLANLLLEPGIHAPLDTLDLSCISCSSNFKFTTWDRIYTLPSQAWAPVVASLKQTLRHCTLGLLAEECYPANLVNLYDTLKQCTRLQSLVIECRVATPPEDSCAIGHPWFHFFDMLADMLSGSPPMSDTGTLSVAWRGAPVPIPPGCTDTCEKLACVLGDRSRYPWLLKRLNVTGRKARAPSMWGVPGGQRA